MTTMTVTPAVARFVRPLSSFIIATSPRSGSWLLSEGLQATNLCGRPREWFHRDAERDRAERWGMKQPGEYGYTEYMERVLRAGTSKNGVFGLKCHWYQLELLPDKLATIDGFQDLPLERSLAKLLPNLKYVWLTRRNKIRQAISLHRARRTGAWWHPDSYETKRRIQGMAYFDPMAIDDAERHLLANEMGWQQWFKNYSVKPLIVIYEDMVENYEATIRQVLHYLELQEADTVPIASTQMKSQSDDKTAEWMRRYVEFKQQNANNHLKQALTAPALPQRPRRWRRRLAENKLVGLSKERIAEDLAKLGIPEAVAAAENRRAEVSPYFQAAKDVARRLRQLEAVCEMNRALSRLRGNEEQVASAATLQRGEFLKDYYAVNRPVVLTELLSALPFRIDADYLKEALGDAMVDEPPPSDIDFDAATQHEPRKILFRQLVDKIMGAGPEYSFGFVGHHQFLEQAKPGSLAKVLASLSEFLEPSQHAGNVSVGIEPSGFIAPLRQSPINTLIACSQGQKTVRLISGTDTDLLYSNGNRVSPVDPERVDAARFPKFQEARVLQLTLRAGEVLFVPVGWWHHERNEEATVAFTISNFAFANRFNLNEREGTTI